MRALRFLPVPAAPFALAAGRGSDCALSVPPVSDKLAGFDMAARRLFLAYALILAALLSGCSRRGMLASPNFDNQPIKAILFFAGEQLDGKNLPENICPPLAGNITAG